MADGGENGNNVTIKVILDTDEAKAKLAELQGELDRVSQRQGGGGVGSGGGVGTASSPSSVVNEVNKSNSKWNNPKNSGKDFGEEATKKISSGAKAIGIAAGMSFAQIVIGELRRWSDLEFKRIMRPDRNNSKEEVEQGKKNGMLSGIGWGAAAGAGIIGLASLALAPFTGGMSLGLGAAGITALTAGAAVAGGVAGGALGSKYGEEDAKLNVRNRNIQRDVGFYLSTLSQDMQWSKFQGQSSLDVMLKYAGDKQSRLGLIRKQISDLEYGEGRNSIRNLVARRDDFRSKNDTNSIEYKENEQKLSTQIQTLQELKRKEFQEQYLTQRIKPWEGSDFADSFSQKGLYMGAQVDVQAANKPVVDELKRLNDQMRGFLSRMTDNLGNRDIGDIAVQTLTHAKYR